MSESQSQSLTSTPTPSPTSTLEISVQSHSCVKFVRNINALLQHEFSHLPITALHFLSPNFLLAGEGGLVGLYCRGDPAGNGERGFICDVKVFERQAVHGIVGLREAVEEGDGAELGKRWNWRWRVLVWGGRLVQVVDVGVGDGGEAGVRCVLLEAVDVGDWVFDVVGGEGGEVVLVTAHNVLFGLDIRGEESGRNPKARRLAEGPRSILYSAHVVTSPGRILVASGTAFGEIIVWSYSTTGQETYVHHSFTGHEGSIFGVQVSPRLSIPNFPSRILASCSDDRTIRLWDTSSVDGIAAQRSTSNTVSQKETGFGSSAPSNELSGNDTCLAIAWGHSSRIWNVQFLSSCNECGFPRLLSTGEDATHQVWDLLPSSQAHPTKEGKNTSLFSLRNLAVASNYHGKNIWAASSIISPHSASSFREIIATGAADGGISTSMAPPGLLAIPYEEPEKADQTPSSSSADDSSEYSDDKNAEGLRDEKECVNNEASQDVSNQENEQEPWKSIEMDEWVQEEVKRKEKITLKLNFGLNFLKDRPKSDSDPSEPPEWCPKSDSSPCPGLSDGPQTLVVDNPSVWKLEQCFYESLTEEKPNDGAKEYASDRFRAFAFSDPETLLITSNEGRVFWMDWEEGSLESTMDVKWFDLGIFPDLKGYAVIAGSPERGSFFFAGSSGILHYLDPSSPADSLSELAEFDCKVAGIFIGHPSGHFHDALLATLSVLITFVGGRPPEVLTVDFSGLGEIPEVSMRYTVKLPPSEIVTSFCHVFERNGREYYIFGTRKGTLEIHENRLPKQEASKQDDALLCETVTDVHHGESVTAIRWYEDIEDRFGHLVTVGRDGCLVVTSLSAILDPYLGKRVCPVVHRAHLSSPFPNIEDIMILRDSVLVAGFHKKTFVVFDMISEKEIFREECYGGNRIWAFRAFPSPVLAYVKESKLVVRALFNLPEYPLRNGMHGREVKAVAVAPCKLWPNSWSPLVATGAEDTDIRIFNWRQISQDPVRVMSQCHAVIRGHNTGIQALKWSEDGKYLFSSGGVEEFYIWRIRRVPIFRVGVVLEAKGKLSNPQTDRRITDFYVRRVLEPGWERIPGSAFVVILVYSDSVIGVWNYEHEYEIPTSTRWLLLGDGHYTACSLTQVTVLSLGYGEPTNWILTAATDGHISIWKFDDIPNRFQSARTTPTSPDTPRSSPGLADVSNDKGKYVVSRREKLHKNAILCLSEHRLSPTTSLVITGGDDNALGITLIQHDTNLRIHKHRISRAHAAAVTGCLVLPGAIEFKNNGRSEFECLVTTASNDQQLRAWKIVVDLNKWGPDAASSIDAIQVTRLFTNYTGVADGSCLAVVKQYGFVDAESSSKTKFHFLVCGVGMEVQSMTVERQPGDARLVKRYSPKSRKKIGSEIPRVEGVDEEDEVDEEMEQGGKEGEEKKENQVEEEIRPEQDQNDEAKANQTEDRKADEEMVDGMSQEKEANVPKNEKENNNSNATQREGYDPSPRYPKRLPPTNSPPVLFLRKGG
ncbi:WD40 repeat-like protein [Aulographum hederae CBS 113979]|uniref:WD40 repeat-like protein n=1 Tax=Aulographum hederae CBS 113979 TaxID=1176131 RepID=A0A6G1HBJ4_9PEZI|nr:WD40 repeat-like protein [Aulographum hederae CBS 113979]